MQKGYKAKLHPSVYDLNVLSSGVIASIPDFEEKILNSTEYSIFPGFCDVHVHFRQPGFSYKETILTGTKAAAHGGYTAVCTMPNLNPVPDSIEHLKEQLDIINKDAVINVYPYAAITVGQSGEKLSDMKALANSVIAFSDDGRGVQSEEMMKEAGAMASLMSGSGPTVFGLAETQEQAENIAAAVRLPDVDVFITKTIAK